MQKYASLTASLTYGKTENRGITMATQPSAPGVNERLKRPPQPSFMRPHQTRLKALELFANRGFGQTSMRDLAAHIGLSPGSLYNHIESKQVLLFELIEELYTCLVKGLARASPARASAQDRLHKLLTIHIELHSKMALYFLVAEREMHCLDQEQTEAIQQLRATYENRLAQLLAECACVDISPQLRALAKSSVSLLNNLPSWFAPDQLDPASRSRLMTSIVRTSIAGTLEELKCPPHSPSKKHRQPIGTS